MYNFFLLVDYSFPGVQCPYGEKCCWGHVCPNGPKCFHLSKGKCWFKGGKDDSFRRIHIPDTFSFFFFRRSYAPRFFLTFNKIQEVSPSYIVRLRGNFIENMLE